MAANAPRSTAPEAPLPSATRDRLGRAAETLISDTRRRISSVTPLATRADEIDRLLADGRLGLARVFAEGQGGIAVEKLRRAAEIYERKGWRSLAADAYQTCGDVAGVERIAASFEADGLILDAAELRRSIASSTPSSPPRR